MENQICNDIGKFLTDNISVRGYSHIVAGKECQDHSISWQGKRYCGIIICDGHGGEKYFRSAIGSEIACKVGQKAIEEYMAKKGRFCGNNFNEQFKQLENNIIYNWRQEVEKDVADNPLDNDERFNALSDADKNALNNNPVKAYGSTFIAAVMTKTYYFVLKLGDGNANVVLSDDSVKSVDGLEDEQLQFNLTTSLCQSNAALEFRHVYVKDESIKGLVLTTDGIINSFRSEEPYRALIKNIFDAYSETNNEKDIENARNELADGLNQLSEKGSGDDLSVAIAIKLKKDDFMDELNMGKIKGILQDIALLAKKDGEKLKLYKDSYSNSDNDDFWDKSFFESNKLVNNGELYNFLEGLDVECLKIVRVIFYIATPSIGESEKITKDSINYYLGLQKMTVPEGQGLDKESIIFDIIHSCIDINILECVFALME